MDLVKWGLAIFCACLMAYVGVLKQDIADRDKPYTLKNIYINGSNNCLSRWLKVDGKRHYLHLYKDEEKNRYLVTLNDFDEEQRIIYWEEYPTKKEAADAFFKILALPRK